MKLMKVFFPRKNNKKTNIETVVPKEEFLLIRKCEKVGQTNL
jgi:hypothetical protein